jgi:hypothetical protein
MDVRKKTLNLDQDKVDRAREILDAPTDTEAIHRALDWVEDSQAIVDDLLGVAGKGKRLFRQRRPVRR